MTPISVGDDGSVVAQVDRWMVRENEGGWSERRRLDPISYDLSIRRKGLSVFRLGPIGAARDDIVRLEAECGDGGGGDGREGRKPIVSL